MPPEQSSVPSLAPQPEIPLPTPEPKPAFAQYQSASTAVLLTKPAAPSADLATTEPTTGEMIPAPPAPRKRGGRLLIGALLLLAIAGTLPYVLSAHAKPTYHPVSLSPTQTTATTSDIAAQQTVPFGSMASDGSFKTTLLRVIHNPVVTGAPADAGTEYLEADFSVTSIANRTNYAFNMGYLPAFQPQNDTLGAIVLGPVDAEGAENPLTFMPMATRTVNISGKDSVSGTALPYDGSTKTVQVYALFEIKKGDAGQLDWQGVDNANYHFQLP